MSRDQIAAIVSKLRNSLWLIPTVLTVSSALLAGGTLALDRSLSSEIVELGIFFSAGSAGARGVLSTIAGSIITVTGVVFSVTIVALQLASTQFTPRVLRTFLEDRSTQVVLGIFIATFTYSLLVLRAVRSPAEDADSFVPGLSVTISVLMALVSIGALIFFVNHVAHSMQVETIIGRVTHDVLERIEALFPQELGEPASDEGGNFWREPEGEPYVVRSSKAGYLQHVDDRRVLDVVTDHDLLLKMEQPVGHFVVEGDTLALVWPAKGGEECGSELADAFLLGNERTLYQDVRRGIIELTDIAVRALSPSVNDPTTAQACIDRITQILTVLGGRHFPTPVRLGKDRQKRVLAIRPTFDEIVHIPYSQLRHFGASQPSIALALIESLERVSQRLIGERVPALSRELVELLRSARRSIDSAADFERIENAAQEALRTMSAVSGKDVLATL